jgi:GMP synthase (glutamine-hydrolysing)
MLEILGKITEVPQTFTPNTFVEEMVAELKEKVGNYQVVLLTFLNEDSTKGRFVTSNYW